MNRTVIAEGITVAGLCLAVAVYRLCGGVMAQSDTPRDRFGHFYRVVIRQIPFTGIQTGDPAFEATLSDNGRGFLSRHIFGFSSAPPDSAKVEWLNNSDFFLFFGYSGEYPIRYHCQYSGNTMYWADRIAEWRKNRWQETCFSSCPPPTR